MVNPEFLSVITLTDSMVQRLPLDIDSSGPLDREARSGRECLNRILNPKTVFGERASSIGSNGSNECLTSNEILPHAIFYLHFCTNFQN